MSKNDFLKLKEEFKELQCLNEGLELNIQNANNDYSVVLKKYENLKKDLGAQKSEKTRLDAKISQLEKYCDKIKAKRDDYKKAWDMTEEKIQKLKTSSQNEIFELKEQIKTLNEQVQIQSSNHFGSGLKRSMVDSNVNESKIEKQESEKSGGKLSEINELADDNIFHKSF